MNALAAAALVAFPMSTRAIDAAKVANTLLDLSGDDQQALLEVMTDYFTSHDEGRFSDNCLQ